MGDPAGRIQGENFVCAEKAVESQGKGEGETGVTGGKGGAGHGENVCRQQRSSANRKLGAFPCTEKLPGARQRKTDGRNKESHARDGINGISLRKSLFPKRVDENGKEFVNLRSGIRKTAPGVAGKRQKCQIGFAISPKSDGTDQTGSKGTEGSTETAAGSAVTGCPRVLRGRADPE